MKIVIKDYLKRLEYEELQRPERARRRVPGLPELAQVAGISRQSIYRLVNGQTKLIDRETLEKIAAHFRCLGFEPRTTDLIRLESEA